MAIPGMPAIDVEGVVPLAAAAAGVVGVFGEEADLAFGFSSASGPWRLLGAGLAMLAISWPAWPIAGAVCAWLLPMFGMLVMSWPAMFIPGMLEWSMGACRLTMQSLSWPSMQRCGAGTAKATLTRARTVAYFIVILVKLEISFLYFLSVMP